MKTKFYFLLTVFVLSLVCFNAMGQKILFVGGADPIDPNDQHIYDSIAGWGYEMTYSEDGAYADVDMSPFDAIVLSESISSSKGAPLQLADYPKPCLNLEGYTVREGKWSWVPWEAGVNELYWFSNKSPDADGLTAVITDNTHYITEGYNLNDEVVWSTSADPGEQVACDLSANIIGSIPLAASKSAANAGKHIIWAIPEGTMVPGALADVPIQRMVVFATHKNSLAPEVTTDGFRELVKKSLEWILGAESTVAVHSIESGFSGVKLLNNPVRENGIISFNLKEAGMVSISAVNLIGQQIILKSNESYSAGQHEISFSTSELNTGIYIYQLNTNKSVFSGKMHIVK